MIPQKVLWEMFDVPLNVPLQQQMWVVKTYGSMKQNKQHYVKSVRIRSFSGPYFPVFGLNAVKYGPEISEYK